MGSRAARARPNRPRLTRTWSGGTRSRSREGTMPSASHASGESTAVRTMIRDDLDSACRILVEQGLCAADGFAAAARGDAGDGQRRLPRRRGGGRHRRRHAVGLRRVHRLRRLHGRCPRRRAAAHRAPDDRRAGATHAGRAAARTSSWPPGSAPPASTSAWSSARPAPSSWSGMFSGPYPKVVRR